MTERVLVGLGNPGAEYQNTRHNAGFAIIDFLAEQFKLPSFQLKHNAMFTKGEIKGHKVGLIKPMSYMNNSGIPLQKLLHFFKIPVQKMIVFHDELELDTARVKMKLGGGHAGHNGLKSIDQHLGSDYWRVRIGIARPKGAQPVSDYVLKNFSNAEKAEIDALKALIIQHINDIMLLQYEQFNSCAGQFFQERNKILAEG